MNCQEFNNIIDELADYKPMPDAVRDASVSHAALCPSCAANLADAREVSSHLLQAARAESEEAPARVKANLLAAFVENAFVQSPTSKVQGRNAVQSLTSNVQRQRQDTPADIGRWTLDFGRRRWFAAAAAIAASVLLAVMFPILREAISPVSQPQSSDLAAGPIGTPAPQTPNSNDSSSAVSSGETPPQNKLPVLSDVTASKPRSTKPRPTTIRSPAVEKGARHAGEYLPLTYMAKGTAIESGTVVRIKLSRFALASLGFNTSVDNSDESIKADVILGDDGVARAIRLVE